MAVKITIEQVPEGGESEIILRCNDPDEALLALIYSVNVGSRKLIGMTGLQMHIIHPRDVYYFEAVDHKVFIYCQEKVYESRLKLYELETEYESGDFFQGLQIQHPECGQDRVAPPGALRKIRGAAAQW
ncbi:LytTR family DNA-binding domain-containing protein [Paenibacillus rhizoplanae]